VLSQAATVNADSPTKEEKETDSGRMVFVKGFFRLVACAFVVGALPACVAALEAEVVVTADGEVMHRHQGDVQATTTRTVVDEPTVISSSSNVDPKCPDRDHLMRCASAYLDTNNNNKLDRVELETAISALPW
jgi:hypothetical protein